jgi:NAD(P)-dependent dehydrogenase (short-subunit alcohol dehydrogenase family)
MAKPQRVAVITGAAGGIGKALVTTFSREGYRVIGIDLKSCRVRQADWITFDLAQLHRQTAEAQEFIKNLRCQCNGRVDASVNNAAVQIVKPVAEVEAPDWDQTLAVNLLAAFWLTQRLLPQLRRARGSVVNIASIHARLTKSKFCLYATSKTALVGLTRSLALELAPEVRVNAILPAATRTPMLLQGFAENPEGFLALGSYHPLGRTARPAEIASAALFLAGVRASFITGTALELDGGIGGCLSDPSPKPKNGMAHHRAEPV